MKEVLASGKAQGDQDEKETEAELQYVWAQYQRKYYVGQIVKDLKHYQKSYKLNFARLNLVSTFLFTS